MKESIPFLVILLFCSLIFISIGIYALKRKTPMHFWSGGDVNPESISNIKSYNKANGIMWIIYGLSFIFSGFITLLIGPGLGAILVSTICVGGLIVTVIVYNRIYNKYKV